MELTIQSNKVFAPVHQSKKRYVILKGSAGSGKSVDTAQQYVIRLLQDKGRNLLCLRKAEVTNRDSTYAELNKAINGMGLNKYFESGIMPMSIRCVNGNKVLFRGVNHEKEREKLKSITFENGNLTDIWIEEATEITQSDFEIADDRLRGTLPEGLFYQIKATFNPVTEHHWIKKAFFDRQDPDVLTHHSTYLDNRFVGEAYYRRMQRRKEIDPDGYRIYGLGEWGEVAGIILSNWEVKDISTKLDDYDDIAIGQDFGFSHANAILTLGFKDDDVFILDEIYEYEKETNELISIADKRKLPRDKVMLCDSAEPDRIKMWRKAGYKAQGVKKTKGADNKSYISSQIDWLKGRKIYIHPSCVSLQKEIQQWRWKKNEQLGIYLDEPISFMDDAISALRYGTDSWRHPMIVKTFRGGI